MTPFSYREPGHADYGVCKFSDDSHIGRVKASEGNSSNYRFFRIEPIKWIVLNYNYLPSQYGTGGDGTHTRLELLANDVLVSGIAPDNTLWQDNTINTYLNDTFSKEALSSESNSRQITSVVYNNTSDLDSNLKENGSNNNYQQSGSNPTTQSLYLLSRYEMVNPSGPYIKNNIFGTNNISDTDKRIPAASDYAKAHNVALNATSGKTTWWLRTTDGIGMYRVSSSGAIGVFDLITNTNIGTRPAMRKTKKGCFIYR